MGRRIVLACLLAVGLLVPLAAVPTAAVPTNRSAVASDAPDPFAISIDETGPFVAGQHLDVAVTGGRSGAIVELVECAPALLGCTQVGFLTLGTTGSGTADVTLRRRVAASPGATDCALEPCVLHAAMYGTQLEATAQIPISIDPAAPVARPSLRVADPDPIVGTGPVTVDGSAFEPLTYVQFAECSWDPPTAVILCARLDGAYAFTDAAGTFSAAVSVSRVLLGTDCAIRFARCQIWAFPPANLDQIWGVPLAFDGSEPAKVPGATVTPSTGLLHNQRVQVGGHDFAPGASVRVDQCTTDQVASGRSCPTLQYPPTDAAGAFTVAVDVRRTIGGADCAVVGCIIRVSGQPVDIVDIPISFDASVPPPPPPALTVEPSTDLVDRQSVEVTVTNLSSGAYVSVATCLADGARCSSWRSLAPPDPTGTVRGEHAVRRILAPDVDCLVAACVVAVQVYDSNGGSTLEAPITFDPDVPPADPPAVRALPATGLWDNQRVVLRGERFDPGGYYGATLCAGDAAVAANCTTGGPITVDGTGTLSGGVSVRRVLPLATGAQDCTVVACSIKVTDWSGGTSYLLPITFDPDGPVGVTDLPAQLECVTWPTDGWPTGPLPAGVDPDAVAALGEQMVGPNGGDSVVVIHGGRLVYENYAEGRSAATIFPSMSVSKSFTSTMVGLLVDDGLLDIDQGSLFPEWSGPSDPRSAITTRDILHMSSGLQWNEDYGDPDSDVVRLVQADDAAALVVAKPLASTPGTVWNYSTGDTMLLSRIIGDAAGVSGPTYEALLHDRLLDPLGIAPVNVGFDAAGRWKAGWWTNTTTRNFAKLGLLYLRHGVWEDQQLLSSDWVDFVRTPSPATSGYGGQFWLNGDGSFSMVGVGGQTVLIVPALDLIVAVNQGGSASSMANLFANASPASCGGPTAVLTDDDTSVAAAGSVLVDVLANDDGGPVGLAPSTLTVATPPAHGSAVIEGGAIRYQPAGGFAGADSFRYLVCTADRHRCLEATVSVTVTP